MVVTLDDMNTTEVREAIANGEFLSDCMFEEEKINKEISHLYTSYVGNYIMDISKEVEEYLKEELGENYPRDLI